MNHPYTPFLHMTFNFPAYRTALEGVFLNIGTNADWSTRLSQIIVIVGLIAAAFLLGYVFRKLVIPVILKVVEKTETQWDDYLINPPVLISLSHLIPCLLIYRFLPRCFDSSDATSFIAISRITQAYITLCVTLILGAFLKNLSTALLELLKEHHVMGILQFLRMCVYVLGGIVLVSQLFGYDPMRVTAGLGAMATVLMLVFKDSILGLVAGIQLSLNRMLKVGDWVTIDKLNINGTVEEISLTTVKVRNFDNTISTIPPYTLVSDSFQNWNGMVNQGARRVKRNLYVNLRTIRFATPELIEQLRARQLYVKPELTLGKEAECTNLALYRSYVTQRLRQSPLVEGTQWAFIRQLNPTPNGLPLEFWFYLKNTAFVRYEEEASLIIEHFIAVLPAFGLELFQSPTGSDLQSFSQLMEKEIADQHPTESTHQ